MESLACYIVCVCLLSHFSHIWLSAILWTAAHRAPLGFSRQEYWSRLPCPPLARGTSWPREGIPCLLKLLCGQWVLYPLALPGKPMLQSMWLQRVGLTTTNFLKIMLSNSILNSISIWAFPGLWKVLDI